MLRLRQVAAPGTPDLIAEVGGLRDDRRVQISHGLTSGQPVAASGRLGGVKALDGRRVPGPGRGDLFQRLPFGDQSLLALVQVGQPGPGGPEVGKHDLKRTGGRLGAVPLELLDGTLGGVGGSEIGTVSGEGVVPMLAGLVGVLGDDVDHVVLPPARHPDVRGGGGGVLSEQQVAGAGGLALGAVDRGRVGELDMLADVGARKGAYVGGPVSVQGQAAVLADRGDGPGVAVADGKVMVVAAGGDTVADADPLPRLCDETAGVVDLAGRDEAVADRAVEGGDLLAGVGDHQQTPAVAPPGAGSGEGVGGELSERVDALGLGGVEADLTTTPQCGPYLTDTLTKWLTPRGTLGRSYRCEVHLRLLCLAFGAAGEGVRRGAGAQREADRGVLGVGEPVGDVEVDQRLDRHPPGGQIEDSPATNGGELVTIAQERHPGAHLVGDHQQRHGGVLVEHPGLVDHKQIASTEDRVRRRHRVGVPGPAPILVPPEAVLVDQPRSGPCDADLAGGDLGSLPRRGHDQHPPALLGQCRLGRGKCGGLAGARDSLEDEESGVPGHDGYRAALGIVEPPQMHPRDLRGSARRIGRQGEPGHDVGLDREHPLGRERADMLRCVGPTDQPDTSAEGTGGEVLGQLMPHGSVGIRPVAAIHFSTSPRMSAPFHADRRAPRRVRTVSTAASRSRSPTRGVPTRSGSPGWTAPWAIGSR
jgi:hypothetical protein